MRWDAPSSSLSNVPWWNNFFCDFWLDFEQKYFYEVKIPSGLIVKIRWIWKSCQSDPCAWPRVQLMKDSNPSVTPYFNFRFFYTISKLEPSFWSIGWAKFTDGWWRKITPREAARRIEETSRKIFQRVLLRKESLNFFLDACHVSWDSWWIWKIGWGCEKFFWGTRWCVKGARIIPEGNPSLSI